MGLVVVLCWALKAPVWVWFLSLFFAACEVYN
nr:MAG TPA: hypothetical protein [Bacteriophage sp.]